MNRGVGLSIGIGFGYLISRVEREIIWLKEGLIQREIIFNSILEGIDFRSEKSKENKQENLDKGSIKKLIDRIEEINRIIEKINKAVLDKWGVDEKINKLDAKEISSLLNKRFAMSFNDEKTLNLANENLNMSIFIELDKTLKSIRHLLIKLEEAEDFDGVKKLKYPYEIHIREAIDILSIGYGKTAVLCVGRTIERKINECFKKLLDSKKISQENFDKKIGGKYIDKIGFLKDFFITDEEFTKLKSYSFDRNKGAHPSMEKPDNNRAKTLIQQGIWLVLDLQKKLDEVKSEDEIEETKAREILGGKSEWGGPILYGSAKEKLEQLKGYGGEMIEGIREEIKKEIEEEKK